MSDHSRIEWTEATWNPVTGCSKVSQGCKNCYALRDWPRLAAPRTPPNIYTGRAFTDVRCHPERLDQPLRWTKPRRIFVNSMSDLFHEDVPNEFIEAIFHRMAMARQHTFQVLTKRAERMRNFLTGGRAFEQPIPNVWLGVSVEDQATANERIPLLLDTPAAVRWVSAEPLLGPVLLTKIHCLSGWLDVLNGWRDIKRANRDSEQWIENRIDWVVAGGESGPNARPMHPDWVHALRDQCQAAGVPFFFKQWGEWKPQVDYYDDENPERDDWCSIACEDPRVRLLTPTGYEWVVGTPGESSRHDGQPPSRTWVMERTGKKAAGRNLDGRTWDEYPGNAANQPSSEVSAEQ